MNHSVYMVRWELNLPSGCVLARAASCPVPGIFCDWPFSIEGQVRLLFPPCNTDCCLACVCLHWDSMRPAAAPDCSSVPYRYIGSTRMAAKVLASCSLQSVAMAYRQGLTKIYTSWASWLYISSWSNHNPCRIAAAPRRFLEQVGRSSLPRARGSQQIDGLNNLGRIDSGQGLESRLLL